ncbi:MAG: peptidase M6, partial [Prevotella sp.]|nr:peptidase M6 [Prevotella sp.]
FTMMDGSELVRPILNIKEDTGIVSFDYLGVKNVVPDGIKHIDYAGKTQGDGGYYTLDGRLAGTSAASLPKGIYILNRHKIVVR